MWATRAWTFLVCACVVAAQEVPDSGDAQLIRHSNAAFNTTATALVAGGTGTILSIGPSTPVFIGNYLQTAYRDFIAPSGFCDEGSTGCTLAAVYTPAELGPLSGITDLTFADSVAAGLSNLRDCVRDEACTVTPSPYTSTGVQTVAESTSVVYGVSQSAVIASLLKSELIEEPLASGAVDFVLNANPKRPNGGMLARFPGAYIPVLQIDFSGATPTDSLRDDPMLTADISRQYDIWTDFPINPLNLLAVVNAVLGGVYLHHTSTLTDGPAQLQGYFQDTTYYLAPTTLLPLVTPLAGIPFIGMPLAKALDPPLRVLVETGYDRTINPGQPTSARLLFPNPINTLAHVAAAIPTGWDDAISYITNDPLNRPFRTLPQPVYGVGGPPVYAGAIDPYVELPEHEPMFAAAVRQSGGPISGDSPGSAGAHDESVVLTPGDSSQYASTPSDSLDRKAHVPHLIAARAQKSDGVYPNRAQLPSKPMARNVRSGPPVEPPSRDAGKPR